MSNHEYDRHNRADAPLGALSPGSTATGDAGSEKHWEAEFGGVARPKVPRSPSNPDALIEGQRVTTAHDMEPGPARNDRSTAGGAMTNRNEHSEQPAEEQDSVADDILAAAPGRLNQDLDDPSESDQDLSPDTPVGSA